MFMNVDHMSSYLGLELQLNTTRSLNKYVDMNEDITRVRKPKW